LFRRLVVLVGIVRVVVAAVFVVVVVVVVVLIGSAIPLGSELVCVGFAGDSADHVVELIDSVSAFSRTAAGDLVRDVWGRHDLELTRVIGAAVDAPGRETRIVRTATEEVACFNTTCVRGVLGRDLRRLFCVALEVQVELKGVARAWKHRAREESRQSGDRVLVAANGSRCLLASNSFGTARAWFGTADSGGDQSVQMATLSYASSGSDANSASEMDASMRDMVERGAGDLIFREPSVKLLECA
jgi:hypothetical protein